MYRGIDVSQHNGIIDWKKVVIVEKREKPNDAKTTTETAHVFLSLFCIATIAS